MLRVIDNYQNQINISELFEVWLVDVAEVIRYRQTERLANLYNWIVLDYFYCQEQKQTSVEIEIKI